MLGRLASFLLGERDDREEKGVMCNIVYENVEDDWVIVDVQDQYPVLKMENAPEENLLIEHPSMSVYSPTIKSSDGEEEAELEDLESLRTVHHAPRNTFCLTGKDGVLYKNHVRFMQRIRLHAERKKLSRNHLLRQNRAWKRHSGKKKTSHCFKQPRPRASRHSRR